MIRNANILVTGGYGFIGANIARACSAPELGNQVTVFDQNTGVGTTGDDFGLRDYEDMTIVKGSVTESADFEKLSPEYDYIVHAAGFLGINKVAEQQLLTLDVNIVGTRTCLDFAAKHNKKPVFLTFSTSEIYGTESEGTSEDMPAVVPTVGRRWCYAASKLTDEYYTKAFNQEYGIPAGIIRPFNVFGANRYGTNAMTQLVTHAINGDELRISGNGQQVRSWCHVDDFCKGALSILEFAGNTPDKVEAFNIGDDRNILTMKNLAEKIIQLTESSSTVNVLHNATEDVLYRVPNIRKAHTFLGYVPSANFNEAIIGVADWVRATQRERRGE